MENPCNLITLVFECKGQFIKRMITDEHNNFTIFLKIINAGIYEFSDIFFFREMKPKMKFVVKHHSISPYRLVFGGQS